MRSYQLYTYDKDGRLIGPPVSVLAENDKSAIDEARKIHSSHYAELFDDQRIIGRLSRIPGTKPSENLAA